MAKVGKKIGNFIVNRRRMTTAVDILAATIIRNKHRPTPIQYIPPTSGLGGRYIVTMLPGIGSGPQMMKYVQDVFETACVPVDFEIIENVNAIKQILDSIKRNRVAIKGTIPDTEDSANNITLRNDLDLYMYQVHCISYPNVRSRITDLDIHIFRQNTEGEYTMLEHESRPGIVESLKIITRENTIRFAHWAYGYARQHKRKKITIAHKANIMKLTDGLFLNTIKKIGADYPEIKTESFIVDNCCMQVVSNPHQFDVILTPNLYGNIIISIICGLIGGHGLISGQNFSDRAAVFEVGLRDIAFEDKMYVNPIAMLNAAVNLCYYLQKKAYGDLISDAMYKTLVMDKIHTPDLGGKHTGSEMVDTIKKHIKNTIKECPKPKVKQKK